MIELLVQVVTGAIGGNVADMFLGFGGDTGLITNTVAGVLGGGIGGQLLSRLGLNGGQGNFDPSNITALLSNVGGSLVGGGALLAIVKIVAPMIGLGGIIGM